MANVIGQRVRRREDPRFLTGQGRYVDDLEPEDALHVQFVRSYMAHARITGDRRRRRGRECPGAGVHRRRHRPGGQSAAAVHPGPRADVPALHRLRQGAVRRRHRRRGAERDARGRLRRRRAGRGRVRAAAGRHRQPRGRPRRGAAVRGRRAPTPPSRSRPRNADPNLFDGCDVVVSGSIESQRMAACPIEPRAVAGAVRGRPADHLAVDPDPAPGQDGAGAARWGSSPTRCA